jgi:hypothetical protein
MNIFYLHQDANECAIQHCDKHVVKMCTEYAQLLSTAHRVVDGDMYVTKSKNNRNIKKYSHPTLDDTLYLACHVNHPSNIWVRESEANYNWLYNMWSNLANEYNRRYGKDHASYVKLSCILATPPKNISTTKTFTQPTPAMKKYPECVVSGDSLKSYRNFYWKDKRRFAVWTTRTEPQWWQEKLKHATIGISV